MKGRTTIRARQHRQDANEAERAGHRYGPTFQPRCNPRIGVPAEREETEGDHQGCQRRRADLVPAGQVPAKTHGDPILRTGTLDVERHRIRARQDPENHPLTMLPEQ